MSSFYLRRGHPWASLGWRFQCPGEVISGTGGQIISKGEVLSWGDGISSGELLGQGNAIWDMGLGISLWSGHPLRLVWILAFATLGWNNGAWRIWPVDCKRMKVPQLSVINRKCTAALVFLALFMVEVWVQLGPISGRQLPGPWDNL